jgi:prophage antirepressor-like protein
MRDSVFSHVTNIQNDKESSSSLIKLFSDFYDPTTRRFVLNNNTSFSFCAKEVADVLGLENIGLSLSTSAAKRVPELVYDLMKECDLGSSRKISTTTIKKLLSQMDVNDEESKF